MLEFCDIGRLVTVARAQRYDFNDALIRGRELALQGCEGAFCALCTYNAQSWYKTMPNVHSNA